LLEETVAHADGRLEGELLALADLGRGELLVVLLEAEHTEGDVAGLVRHHVAEQLLEQRPVVIWCMNPKAASASPSTMICMPR